MGYNGSLDFMNMIKNTQTNNAEEVLKKERVIAAETVNTVKGDEVKAEGMRHVTTMPQSECIAVIDTETNWRDEVMSIGIAIADAGSFKCLDKKYYIIEPECLVGGYYSNVLNLRGLSSINAGRDKTMEDIRKYLGKNNVTKIFAYNASFDYGHLPELSQFEWFDIMRIAAYRQFNRAIPDNLPCCKSGRLKSNYGVEPIMRLLTGDETYREMHNAVYDAVDELRIVELMGLTLDAYEIAKI